MKLLNAYIGGRKCAVALSESESAIVLFSHSKKWDDGTRYANMYAWKFARRFVVAGLPGTLAEAAAFVGTSLGLSVVLEGSEEFAAIRANIRRVERRGRRSGSGAESGAESVPETLPESVPEVKVPEVKVPEVKPQTSATLPACFESLRATLQAFGTEFGVYLYGPAGTGKGYTCRLLAESLGLAFHSVNAVMDVCDLEGYRDANGVYHETEFYRAFKYGGLFLFDEFDGSIPEAVLRVNDALANGRMTFAGEVVEVHPDFRLVCAGNTVGKGATAEYSARAALDLATLDRFQMRVLLDYDKRVELSIAGGRADLVTFVHDLRAAAKTAGISAVFSYRLIKSASRLAGVLPLPEIIKNGVFGGWELDDVRALCRSLKGRDNNAWTAAALAYAGM